MDKVCAVFGGSRGIGKAIVKDFMNEGYKVAVISRNLETIEKTVSELQELVNGKDVVHGEVCDISKEDMIHKSISNINKKWGNIDVLVNSAGINQDNLLLKTDLSDMNEILQTNLVGPMLTSKIVLRGMLQKKHGTIINIGSIVANTGNIGQCAYSSSKAGLIGLTKSLAKEVASRGITVNLVAPGYISTDMTAEMQKIGPAKLAIPMKRFGNPEEIAQTVSFLVKARYITGQRCIIYR
ncbi:carbonyl reductase family member 4-like isoform X2 [Tubulanus polymorphus]|uniref:carbonyl reductase family member 4-like isoform X2 n=1 Tax=Tubulanus polymorphus TaxID=672921 RepID=UPI003DA685D7